MSKRTQHTSVEGAALGDEINEILAAHGLGSMVILMHYTAEGDDHVEAISQFSSDELAGVLRNFASAIDAHAEAVKNAPFSTGNALGQAVKGVSKRNVN